MRNEFTGFKVYLQLLSPQEQIFEINCMIDDLMKDNTSYFNINSKYGRIKELKKLKHKILLDNQSR